MDSLIYVSVFVVALHDTGYGIILDNNNNIGDCSYFYVTSNDG